MPAVAAPMVDAASASPGLEEAAVPHPAARDARAAVVDLIRIKFQEFRCLNIFNLIRREIDIIGVTEFTDWRIDTQLPHGH
jgi:hypothetical protein